MLAFLLKTRQCRVLFGVRLRSTHFFWYFVCTSLVVVFRFLISLYFTLYHFGICFFLCFSHFVSANIISSCSDNSPIFSCHTMYNQIKGRGWRWKTEEKRFVR